jgi:hypothetical protein
MITPGHMGNVFGDAWDAVADVVTSVVDRISDAGATIGSALKFVAPVVALWPGIGTGISVAMSAAAAYASGDKIEDAIVDIAAGAIPGGPPRVIFQAAADVSREALAGRPVLDAVLVAARQTAGAVGGDRAVAAFDQGVALAQGGDLSAASVAALRSQAQASGTAALAAFDAGVAITRGGDASDVVLAAGRDYIGAAGGPALLAGFDMGIALARGKDLQDAGFVALSSFAAGNDGAERAIHFAEAMTRAAQEGRDLGAVLRDELGAAFARYGAQATEQLEGLIARWSPYWSSLGSGELAALLGVAEPVARAAQAAMREGAPDRALVDELGAAVARARGGAFESAGVAQSKVELLRVLAHQAELVAPQARAVSHRQLLADVFGAPPVKVAPAPRVPPAIIAAAAPVVKVSRSTAVQDALLVATVAGALGALYWWATSDRAT